MPSEIWSSARLPTTARSASRSIPPGFTSRG
jgi:hypothetical protein